MNVKNINIKDIQPYKKNAKKHDETQRNKLPYLKRDYEKYLRKLYKRLKI